MRSPHNHFRTPRGIIFTEPFIVQFALRQGIIMPKNQYYNNIIFRNNKLKKGDIILTIRKFQNGSCIPKAQRAA